MTSHNTDQPKGRFPKLALLAPLSLLLALGLWVFGPSADRASTYEPSSTAILTEEPPPPPPHEGRRRPPHHRGRHHGPPGVPPTVIFLVGGALGYLIGRRGPGCCGKHHRAHRYDSASELRGKEEG